MPTGDEILEWKKQVEAREWEEIIECPFCGWELDVNDKKERACPVCGRVWR